MKQMMFAALLMLLVPVAQAQPAEAMLKVYDQLEWTEIVPGISFAAAYGDWMSEPHGKFVRIDPGVATPMHTHTLPYHGIVITGRVTNPYEAEDQPVEMGPGDYWFVPGEAAHVTACASEEPCLFYTYGEGAWDLAVIE